MIGLLFINLKYTLVLGLLVLTPKLVTANSTEYVFSAPPENGKELVEIPTQETEYPLYECDEEVIEETAEDNAIDGHGCDPPELEEAGEDTAENEQLSSKNKLKK